MIDAPGLRPTPDRVRETLFNWLGHDLSGLRCLDLFAGTGILGFEAASRGALQVTWVEHEPRVFNALRANAAILDCAGQQLVHADALEFASCTVAGQIDLLFLDPPYAKGWLERLAAVIPRLAAPGMRIYAEAEHFVSHLGAWTTVKSGRAGCVFFHLMERIITQLPIDPDEINDAHNNSHLPRNL